MTSEAHDRNGRARACRRNGEAGVALITTLLVLMLMSALMAGFFASIHADQQSSAVNRDQTQAYAAAHAGLEKLTSDLATLFLEDVSPSAAQINALKTHPPAIPGFEYRAPGGATGSGYDITFAADGNGNPAPENTSGSNITSGPYAGFKGIVTKFPITVTARTTTADGTGGAEVRLRRELQTVAVPVFQFGIFSESDLTFYAGDDFDFGGRVHTNGNLFLSELTGHTLTFSDKITAVRNVVRSHFSNGLSVNTYSFTGNVNVVTAFTAPPTYRALKLSPNEGSIAGFVGSAANPNWTSISVGTYKNNIRTGLTGAKKLDLPLVSQGARPIDLIRRPAVNSSEDTVNGPVYNQRLYSKASLRILLSDRPGDILNLPTVTSAAPVLLDGDWNAAPPNNGIGSYGPVDATHPPAARSIGPIAATTVAAGSTVAQINVAAIPATLKVPAVVRVGTFNATCTARTATTFTGCSGITGAVANGSQVTATLGSGATARTTTTVAIAAAGATSVTVVSTAAFAPGLMWVNGTAVSCTGYDAAASPQRFSGCAGLAANPSTGQAISTSALAAANSSLLGGYLKVERQNTDQTWTDVTMEILNLGIGAANSEGTLCADPTPNAVLRLQRLRDNGGGACNYASSTNPYDWWSNALYDPREGNFRDVATTGNLAMGGTMHYIALDVNNLRRWFNGTIGTTGTSANSPNENGYIVYFSDRRGNHNPALPLGAGPAGDETGEYGFEDVVNPASATGTPNAALDSGEDVNGSLALDVYGQTPIAAFLPAGTADPYSTNGRPWSVVTSAQARVNRPVLFRRALKLINGGISGGVNNLPASGLTVTSENPVYVQGNYNATTDPQAEPNVPAAVMADAVTLLSNNFNDARSFRLGNDASSRSATTTGYRFAVIAGKGLSFTYPAAGTPHFLFGTDGGVGNFLRLLENWNIAGVSINYRGSMVSLYTSRQAVGTFKYGPNVYDFGDRNFTFDTDFLLPALLPPGSPAFRDVNTLTFRQLLRPTQ